MPLIPIERLNVGALNEKNAGALGLKWLEFVALGEAECELFIAFLTDGFATEAWPLLADALEFHVLACDPYDSTESQLLVELNRLRFATGAMSSPHSEPDRSLVASAEWIERAVAGLRNDRDGARQFGIRVLTGIFLSLAALELDEEHAIRVGLANCGRLVLERLRWTFSLKDADTSDARCFHRALFAEAAHYRAEQIFLGLSEQIAPIASPPESETSLEHARSDQAIIAEFLHLDRKSKPSKVFARSFGPKLTRDVKHFLKYMAKGAGPQHGRD